MQVSDNFKYNFYTRFDVILSLHNSFFIDKVRNFYKVKFLSIMYITQVIQLIAASCDFE